jgi:hypothetical protein
MIFFGILNSPLFGPEQISGLAAANLERKAANRSQSRLQHHILEIVQMDSIIAANHVNVQLRMSASSGNSIPTKIIEDIRHNTTTVAQERERNNQC